MDLEPQGLSTTSTADGSRGRSVGKADRQEMWHRQGPELFWWLVFIVSRRGQKKGGLTSGCAMR